MFSPFRVNAKKDPLEPSNWQKFQFGMMMAWMWVKNKANSFGRFIARLACDIFDYLPAFVLVAFVCSFFYAWWYFTKDDAKRDAEYNLKMKEAPCSVFAANKLQDVPLRCVPGYNNGKK